MDKINEYGDKLFDFISKYNDDPKFWIIIFVIILVIMVFTIRDLGNK